MYEVFLERKAERDLKKTINEIMKGKAAIIPDTEIQLERALGVTASFWNNLERNFQVTLARLSEEVIPFSSMNYMKNHLRFREE